MQRSSPLMPPSLFRRATPRSGSRGTVPFCTLQTPGNGPVGKDSPIAVALVIPVCPGLDWTGPYWTVLAHKQAVRRVRVGSVVSAIGCHPISPNGSEHTCKPATLLRGASKLWLAAAAAAAAAGSACSGASIGAGQRPFLKHRNYFAHHASRSPPLLQSTSTCCNPVPLSATPWSPLAL